MAKIQMVVGGEGQAVSSLNSPEFQKYSKKAFSIAEALIALLIGSLILGMSAPIISKQIKYNNFSDAQVNLFSKKFEEIERRLAQKDSEILALRQELDGLDIGVPVGTVAFFNSDSCPDDTWQNVVDYGWGGYFFRVADASNTRNVAQEQSIQSHWHVINVKQTDKNASWASSAYRALYISGTRDPVVSADVIRSGANSAPYVSVADETRPKNIPLTTCLKVR